MGPNTNISQELLETVEHYLNNRMSDDELEKFENKFNNDKAFKSQVEDIKTLLLGIESQSLKEKLEVFHDDIPDKIVARNSSKVRYLQFIKIAAAAAIIIALGSLWFLNQNPNAKLYTDYFSPDPGLATIMSSNSNFKFYDAMVNYKQGDYKTAISKWTTLLETKSQNDTLNYFLGVAHLANKQEIEAIPYLEKVTTNIESHFKNDAYYYLGLAFCLNLTTKNS